MFSASISLFVPFYFILTVNKIGETGATSLSEALKSNATLAELNLGCEYINTQRALTPNLTLLS